MITKSQNGAAAVELGIILPLLILVLFGIIEFALLLFNQQIITNAAREGARAGIVSRGDRFEGADTVDVEAVVNNWLAEHLVCSQSQLWRFSCRGPEDPSVCRQPI